MKRYITAAIDYVNSLPHIGTAYEKIGIDVLARFYRLLGDEVLVQLGNDEHSVNVQKSAQAKGLSPLAYCNEMRPQFENMWLKLDIHFDQFIQTTETRHHETVAKLFTKIFEVGDIYQKDYEGWYCESCEAFYTDKDLASGQCPQHKSKPKWLKEKNYFFRLSKYRDFLLQHIEANPRFILPTKRRNEIVSFLKQGLADVSVSRSSFDWGIPLPIEKKHVIYVWFDALINYITGVDYLNESQKFKDYWPAHFHVIGKDITRFHCVIWPAMLKSANLPLPHTILGHGFVYLKGERMSKSLGNVVSPLDIVKAYPNFGSDALRYYLMRTSSFGDDCDFTWDDFIQRYNADLANGLGNLVSRTMGMIWRYQNGKVLAQKLPKDEQTLLQKAQSVFKEVQKNLDPNQTGDLNSHFAIEKIWNYLTQIDQYIDKKEPWNLAKDESKTQELSQVLTTVIEAIRLIVILVSPFIPRAAQKIWQGLGFDEWQDFAKIRATDFVQVPFVKKDYLLPTQKLTVFPRIETEKKNCEPQESPKPDELEKINVEDGMIDFKEFGKVNLKVAKVLSAEKVEGADKLLKLQIALGEEERQIVAGIAEFYKPDDLIGKLIIVVTNLKPAKIRGVESQGMLLAAKEGGRVVVLSPEAEIAAGASVS